MFNSVGSKSKRIINEFDAHRIVRKSLRINGKRSKRSKGRISLDKCEMESLLMGKCPNSMSRDEIVFWFAQLLFMVIVEDNFEHESKEFIVWIRSHIYKKNFDVAVNLISSIPVFQMKRLLLDFDVCNGVRTKRLICDQNAKAMVIKKIPLVVAENSEFDRLLRKAVLNFDGDRKQNRIVKDLFYLKNKDGSVFGR